MRMLARHFLHCRREGHRALGALLLLILASGCAVDSLPESLALPKDDPSFRSRVYGGASVGSSTLSPNTGDTVYRVQNDEAVATQLRLGIDVHSRLSLELDSTMLGSAELNGSDADVQFASLGGSALIYAFTGKDRNIRREGLSGYFRVGFAGVKKASVVQPLDGSDSGTLYGLGVEYGFANGLGLRAEATQIDDEAVFLGIGAVYRLGAPRDIKEVFVAAASNATQTPVENSKQRTSLLGAEHASPVINTGLQTSASKPSRYDEDGDGIKNKMDACDNTAFNVAVDQRGCGLFDRNVAGVSFKPGSFSITQESREKLKELAETLKVFPEVRVQVQAHTDNQGDASLNYALSKKRASNVVDYLVKIGIPKQQLSSRGMGSSEPIANNATAEGRALNRRLSLLTLPSMTAEMLAAVSLSHTDPGDHEAAEATPPIKRRLSDAVVKKLSQAVAHEPKEEMVAVATATAITPLPPTRPVLGLNLPSISAAMQFETVDGASLKPQSVSTLRQFSRDLKRYPDVRISVQTHVDERGDENSAMRLTEQRAKAIVSQLVMLGIPQQRLEPVGFGSQLPVAQALSEADRARNRRVEFRVIP
ncbi:MAG: OmpA family protein [Gammaproteobacteria bacterium]|nr:OmpA family protein [Gammaproteobacteria bacterium]